MMISIVTLHNRARMPAYVCQMCARQLMVGSDCEAEAESVSLSTAHLLSVVGLDVAHHHHHLEGFLATLLSCCLCRCWLQRLRLQALTTCWMLSCWLAARYVSACMLLITAGMHQPYVGQWLLATLITSNDLQRSCRSEPLCRSDCH